MTTKKKMNSEQLERRNQTLEREMELEAALEKVRSRAMTMQSSDELLEASDVMLAELEKLKINALRIGICTMDAATGASEIWTRFESKDKKGNKVLGVVPKGVHHVFDDMVNSWLAKEPYFANTRKGNEVVEYYKKLVPFLPYPLPKTFNDSETISCFFFLEGSINVVSLAPLNAEECKIVLRFAKVFEQTYIRFLDLQKAEEQAREAQIEVALERVRARAMAMQKSEVLYEVAEVLYKEMSALKFTPFINVGYIEIDEEDKIQNGWLSNPKGAKMERFRLPLLGDSILEKRYESWKKQEPLFCQIVGGQDLKKHIDLVRPHFGTKQVEEAVAEFSDPTVFYCGNFHKGYLHVTLDTKMTHEEEALFIRFTKVFEQTYTRFLDLQKAEAQAREAQIETAMERVRSQTNGMRDSKELSKIAAEVYHQVQLLGIEPWSFGFNIFDDDYKTITQWVSTADGSPIVPFQTPANEDVFIQFTNAAQKEKKLYVEEIGGEKLIKHYEYMSSLPVLSDVFKELKAAGVVLPSFQVFNLAFFNQGYLMFITFEQLPEAHDIFKRFANVFEQTYTRFLDLQKAEAQAREAQIEASLERIRTQAMAMRHSDDLIKSTTILFEELEKLKLPIERSGIGIFDKETKDCELWTMVVSKDGKKELATGITSMTVHPMLVETFEAWLAQKPVSYTLEGQDLIDYYQLISKGDFHLSQEAIGSSSSLAKEYYEYVPFGGGGVYFFSDSQPQDADKQIMRRFADVFHLTYTRYQDLQKAEARAKEAIKQASLERVRGEIASMRSKEDFNRITPLVWNELKTLEVPFIRCGVFIVNETMQHIEVYLSSSEGKALGALDLAFDSNELTEKTITAWRKKKIYHQHWNQEEFKNWTQLMMNEGQVKDQKTYQGTENAPESLDLHFIPFTQGMLYVGSIAALEKDNLDLVQSLADSFALAYARYEDFVKLEKAKAAIEATLNELKATQKQLIQSEKMASLGELTAGIAHEIQNPLNFVNNFSEVSEEMIQEIKEERLKTKDQRDEALEDEILNDIEQNLQKINHHGQRASSIVKGMLEHSRASSGKKVPTDINALADEYLRLAYHGLRAKDKSFQSDFQTDFDVSLPKIEVIPQDIGRVLLNLINNAFQACAERSRSAASDEYKPTVSISTSQEPKADGSKLVAISITDNGPGIPDEIKDKIFQPFFTTKDTGKGTGLGLSLAYDIVKAHGGELTLESEENEGATFIIQLPK